MPSSRSVRRRASRLDDGEHAPQPRFLAELRRGTLGVGNLEQVEEERELLFERAVE